MSVNFSTPPRPDVVHEICVRRYPSRRTKSPRRPGRLRHRYRRQPPPKLEPTTAILSGSTSGRDCMKVIATGCLPPGRAQQMAEQAVAVAHRAYRNAARRTPVHKHVRRTGDVFGILAASEPVSTRTAGRAHRDLIVWPMYDARNIQVAGFEWTFSSRNLRRVLSVIRRTP